MQVFANKENIGALTKLSNTVVRLAPSVITIGARQYTTGILDCDTGTDLDTGSVESNKGYYVYAVVELGNVVLKASLSAIAPSGYTSFTAVGGFSTDGSSNVSNIGDIKNDGSLAFSIQPTQTILTASSGTYNTPFGVKRLRVRMVGGGGGAGGSNGGNTTFGSILTANGGAFGGTPYNPGGVGGLGTINLPAYGYIHQGDAGSCGMSYNNAHGGQGGGSMLSGGPTNDMVTGGSNAGYPGTSYGAGGSGWAGYANVVYSGGGGGGGVDAIVPNPDSSYAYTIGAGGSSSHVGVGYQGVIIIEEYYE